MKKLAYLMRRVAQGLLVLALIAVINFLLIRAAPGDPAAVMAGEAGAADEAFVAQLRERFGLDKPLPQQLATYLGHAARLDLGDSYRQQRPVMSLIGERLPATLLLTLTAFVVSLTLAWHWAPGAAPAPAPGSTAWSARCRCCSTPRRYSGWR